MKAETPEFAICSDAPQKQVLESAVQYADPGVVPGSDGANVRFYRALLYSRLNRVDDCRADLEKVAADPEAPAGVQRFAAERLSRMRSGSSR